MYMYDSLKIQNKRRGKLSRARVEEEAVTVAIASKTQSAPTYGQLHVCTVTGTGNVGRLTGRK